MMGDTDDMQFGFMKGKGTTDAKLHVIDHNLLPDSVPVPEIPVINTIKRQIMYVMLTLIK